MSIGTVSIASILVAFWGPEHIHQFARLEMHRCAVNGLQRLQWFDEETSAVHGARLATVERLSAREGLMRRRLVNHRSRERSLRLAKLRAAMASAKDGCLRCKVPSCRFDFQAIYGDQGSGAAEVHHKTPLASLAMEVIFPGRDAKQDCQSRYLVVMP
jgi:predicted HNH restriction endonuclease